MSFTQSGKHVYELNDIYLSYSVMLIFVVTLWTIWFKMKLIDLSKTLKLFLVFIYAILKSLLRYIEHGSNLTIDLYFDYLSGIYLL